MTQNSMFYGATPAIFENAKLLRENMTYAEKMLWERLSNSHTKGYKFRRQHPIGTFIADFYCHEAKLVIEVGAEFHKEEEKNEYDEDKVYEIEQWGIKVLRFSNEEVRNNINYVVKTIKDYLKTLKQP